MLTSSLLADVNGTDMATCSCCESLTGERGETLERRDPAPRLLPVEREALLATAGVLSSRKGGPLDNLDVDVADSEALPVSSFARSSPACVANTSSDSDACKGTERDDDDLAEAGDDDPMSIGEARADAESTPGVVADDVVFSCCGAVGDDRGEGIAERRGGRPRPRPRRPTPGDGDVAGDFVNATVSPGLGSERAELADTDTDTEKDFYTGCWASVEKAYTIVSIHSRATIQLLSD
eukprot:scpid27266/ scgid26621/ 